DEEIADFARRMDRLVQYMQVFSGTAAAIDSAMKENPTMFKDVPLSKLSNLRYLQGKLAAIREEFVIMNNEFTTNYTAKPNGIENITQAERTVRALQRNFYKFSDAVTKSTRLLWKIVSSIRRSVDIEVDEQRQKLKKLKEDYDKIADKKNYLSHIAQKDKKGNYVHKLIEKYDRVRFRDELLTAIKNNDTLWVKDNINFSEY